MTCFLRGAFGCVFLAGLLLLLDSGSARAADVVGAMAADFGVTPEGGASLMVPISVPPGTTGVQPKITLQLGNGGASGPLGVGGSVGGISYITRCPQNKYFDGATIPVRYAATDRFCLNGQRLVPISGTYGANGTEYRTSYDEFSKIISYGTAGSGPQRFEVYKQSGEILQYGQTTDSRIEAPGRSDVRVWALNEIADRAGNAITFKYFEDTTSGEFGIEKIEYTKNASQNLNAYNRVDFIYATRPDTQYIFEAGGKISQTKRLTNVKSYAENTLFRDYQITYGTGARNRSRVSSIKECTATDCFPASTISWTSNGSAQFAEVALSGTLGVTGAAFADYKVAGSGDFNGDGLTDLYLMPVDDKGRIKNTSTHYVFLGKTDGTFTTVNYSPTIPSPGPANYIQYKVSGAGDINGDGLTDLFVMLSDNFGRSGSTSYYYTWISDGDGTFTPVNLGFPQGAVNNYGVSAVGDFNGDGRTDLHLMVMDDYNRSNGNANDYLWVGRTDGKFDSVLLSGTQGITGSAYDDYVVATTGDFNGDGLSDFYLMKANTSGGTQGVLSTSYFWMSNTDNTFTTVALPETRPENYRVGAADDFNGDGLVDLFFHKASSKSGNSSSTSDYFIMISRGDGTFENNPIAVPTGYWNDHILAAVDDFDGDGLPDMYWYRGDGTGRVADVASAEHWVWFNKGNSTFVRTAVGVANGSYRKYSVAASGDFTGDGLADLYWLRSDEYGRSNGDGADYVRVNAWQIPDLLAGVQNGVGNNASVQYQPLTNSTVYTKGTGATYPVQDIIGPMRVVRTLNTRSGASDGSAAGTSQTYEYEALRNHVNGLGSLGFAKTRVKDSQTNIVTESVFSQDYATRKEGLLTSAKKTTSTNVVFENKTLTWTVTSLPTADGSPRYSRFNTQTVTAKRDLNNVLTATITETTTYDAYGYPTNIVNQTVNGSNTFRKTTVNVYTHTPSNWKLGRLTSATVTHQAPGQPNQVRSSGFTYHPTTGLMTSETIQPGDALFHTKTYAHNGFGAVTSVTETWGSPDTDGITATSRVTSYTYDAKSRYKLTETNPLNHVQTTAYHPVHGLPVSTTGPNNLTTSWEYDAFGRVTKETRSDGTQTVTTRSKHVPFDPPFCLPPFIPCQQPPAGEIGLAETARIKTVVTTTGAPTVTTYEDLLYREVRKTVQALDGRLLHVDTLYDRMGRVSKKSEPFYDGATPLWTTITYDLLDRPLTTTAPDSSTQTVSYNGLIETSTNELNQTKTVRKDAMGQMVEVKDHDLNTTTYVYDALGQLISMSDPSSNVTTTTYDVRGNKIAMSDPDKGSWTYRYNALGLLVEQTDAKGQVTHMTYDVLGRMLTRIDDATAANPASRTATWVYDTATKGIGKLHSVSMPGYSATSSYDSLGRPSATTEVIDGLSFTSQVTYDASGRPQDTIYPTGLTVRNVYNARGYLEVVQNTAGTQEYWRALAADERGNITQFRLGNGVESIRAYNPLTGFLDSIYSSKATTAIQNLTYGFNALGNLVSRTDARQSLSESFIYDNLNRVTSSTVNSGSGNVTVSVTYNALGNITSKSDVGTYTYAQLHGGCTGGAQPGPHAVTQVSGIKNATYCYDANGNMTSGDGKLVSYTAFDMASLISKGGKSVAITYGPDRARYKRVDTGTTGTVTTLYIGGKAMERINRGGVIETKHYIGDFAVVTTSGTTTQTSYLLRDHLGSVDVITDEAGAVLERMSFDAWGKRREVTWQAMADATAYVPLVTTRGFTGHEQLDPVGLVHMNGRVYDPELGDGPPLWWEGNPLVGPLGSS
ncbi:FG-GAP-like repeat-containing protein [Rhodoligotrophos defluvii]|uniref:FG-GAP-like repeat-containing protein n=2 Tax=Rhodoligotrophos defluvii TaxID=2561934 RepID=UPI0010C93D1B|nr:FG-GAP-like repeat-containing protein [Rhodoligotrophos defluvii]